MILKNIETALIQDVKIENLSFKLLADHLTLKNFNFNSCDGIIIRSKNIERVKYILSTIRNSDTPEVYLMPIYLESKSLASKLTQEVDGFIQEGRNPIIAEKSINIHNKIKSVVRDLNKIDDLTEKIIIKSLQYVWSRENSLAPYATRFSPIGYQIPFLSSIIQDQDLIDVFSRLRKLENKSFLKAVLADKVNLCNSCLSSYLNFHETCLKCSSLELEYENLIHHFRCAYIGPESDFQQESDLVCPKCDKHLKHIGIDYDKPSEIAKCTHCNHSSQETTMKAKCVDCGQHNELGQLNTLDISEFAITSLGENWVLQNDMEFDEKPKELNDLRIVPHTIFDLLVQQEKERIKSTPKISSFVGQVKIKESVFAHLNLEFREKLKLEILTILQNYLRNHDILCAHNAGFYSFLLPDIKQASAYLHYEVVLDNLNKILSDNLTGSKDMISGDLKKL